MTRLPLFFLLCCSAILAPFASFSQYILNGNAKQESCNCYLLTEPQLWQGGSVWQSTKIDLNNSFDFSFSVYLGCSDAEGADGIAFILQPLSTNLGVNGGGMGFSGVSPSIGILLDTWQNTEDNDPAFDHISIQANGIIQHGNDLAGPVPASSTNNNIEDCQWHVLRIKWDAPGHTLSTYFDGVMRLSAQKDLIAGIFKNDPMVYWGFSAATGGKSNTQKFCTALNPVFNSGVTDDEFCFGTPVTFSDNSTSFTTIKSYYWDFGDGTTSTLANPPAHIYSEPGIYTVTHSITAMDNCQSEPFTRTIKIGDKPQLSFEIFDTCETVSPRFNINSSVNVGAVDQWKWDVDGTTFSTLQNPDFTKLTAGTHSIKLTVESNLGCVSDPFTNNTTIKPKPGVAFDTKDGCVNAAVLFSAEQTDQLTTIKNWQWEFGDGIFSDKKDTQLIFTQKGNYPVMLTAVSESGCESSFSKNIFINEASANAGSDTLVVPDTFFNLSGSGGASYLWLPATGLSDPGIANPTASISDETTYHLTVTTAEGCADTASVHISVFKGSGLYVPTAFTPNGDGLNDILRPYYIGIKSLSYFTIFNSWGQKVFSTNDMKAGWNGSFKGNQSNAGSYVWVLKATDVVGKPFDLKGSFVLIR